MKSLFLLFTITCSSLLNTDDGFIDPTGTYILKGEVQKNKIISHSGEIRVKLLDNGKVAISFYINKGYPGYESVSFVDTLPYADNLAKYNPAAYADCTIIFAFSNKDAEIQQVYTDPQSGCFGKDILISTFFKKSSSDKPVIQDLSAHGVTE